MKLSFPSCLFVLNISLLSFSLFAGIANGNIEYYFKEGRLMTFFSSFQLIAIAVFCGIIAESKAQTRSIHIWSLIALGFVFLAFDEVLMIHEMIDFRIHDWLNMQETALSDRIDDLIVLLYLLIGLSLFWYYRDCLLPHLPIVKQYALPTLVLIGYTIIADILSNRQDIISNDLVFNIIEKSEDFAKILAEYILLIATYRVWKTTTNFNHTTPR